jgi:ribonuclease J
MTGTFPMRSDAVYFVPLGGCGIFGSNMSLYGYQDQWILVDCGAGFADEGLPGVEILLPDPSFAESIRHKILGMVITHAHEDHIGAIEHLWPRLRVPIYATAFTRERVKQSIADRSWGFEVRLHEVEAGGKLNLGPFSIRFIRMAHSIPEMSALAVTVKGAGTILHTGDWKIDDAPGEGWLTDQKELENLGAAGVLAIVGDSTNSMVEGHSGSEAQVVQGLTEVFSKYQNTIAVTCFSTNVARLRSIYEAARKSKRHVCLLGRSLWAVDDAARKTGYLKDIPPFLTDEEASQVPSFRVVYVCTGSQGEPRAALARIANDDHKALRLGKGDVVIFSSRAIPGNDTRINRVKNSLLAMGVEIISDSDAMVHVSGHPYRDEMRKLYSWVKPNAALPVHGEHMQQAQHAELATSMGVPHTMIPQNGNVIEIDADGVGIVATVEHGILAIEGNRIVPIDHDAILMRKRIMWNGSAVITVVVDEKGALLAPIKMTTLGLLDEDNEHDAEYIAAAIVQAERALEKTPKGQRHDDEAMAEAVRVAVRRYFEDTFGRKPQTRVHLVRV